MNLLHVRGRLVLFEPRQAALLDRILAAPLLDLAALGLAAPDLGGRALGPENGADSDEGA